MAEWGLRAVQFRSELPQKRWEEEEEEVKELDSDPPPDDDISDVIIDIEEFDWDEDFGKAL